MLDKIEASFQLLSKGPARVSVDGGALGFGLPTRSMSLPELQAILLHPSCSTAARDAAWSLLVSSAQTDGPQWVIGALGVALPRLRTMAGRLTRGYCGCTADLDAELVTAFVERLRRADANASSLCGRLCWGAYKDALRAKKKDVDEVGRHADLSATIVHQDSAGHPDLVLARAVRASIITAAEAELISRTRIGGERLTDIAAEQGTNVDALRMRRKRAERRLAAAMECGDL
ncbi:hypothetical protein [Fodinicola acaciae]|uniref:hypothetical protein n=1 Tax=Fodinicola acaciae TaxID=2681555 RepID=UPI0013CF7596|nr:hypothetical protein [Fodinicola acaciae]